MHDYSLLHSSDAEVLAGLTRFNDENRQSLAQLLCHMAEVERRRLHVERGYASLFTYAVQFLGFSEDQAMKRIQAARTARLYPVVFELVARGDLHLTGVNIVAPHLTAENHQDRLAQASCKTKRQVEELVVTWAPKPDAPTLLRRLPEQAARHEMLNLPIAALGQSVVPSDEAHRAQSSTPDRAEPNSTGPRPSVKPLSPGRYRLQVTLSQAANENLRKAQAMMRHQNPTGDVTMVIEKALAFLTETLQSRKFGKLKKSAVKEKLAGRTLRKNVAPVKSAAPLDCTANTADAANTLNPANAAARVASQQTATAAAAKASAKKRYVPRPVRREVFARDGEQCTYVSPDGHRCSEHASLELDHHPALARGGASTVEGLRVLCRSHNAHQARLDFGEAYLRRRIREKHREEGTRGQVVDR